MPSRMRSSTAVEKLQEDVAWIVGELYSILGIGKNTEVKWHGQGRLWRVWEQRIRTVREEGERCQGAREPSSHDQEVNQKLWTEAGF